MLQLEESLSLISFFFNLFYLLLTFPSSFRTYLLVIYSHLLPHSTRSCPTRTFHAFLSSCLASHAQLVTPLLRVSQWSLLTTVLKEHSKMNCLFQLKYSILKLDLKKFLWFKPKTKLLWKKRHVYKTKLQETKPKYLAKKKTKYVYNHYVSIC